MNHGDSHGMGKHMLLMAICCLVPIGLILGVGALGLSLGPLQPLVPYAIALMCPLMMVVMMWGMMRGNHDEHSHHPEDAPLAQLSKPIPETSPSAVKTGAVSDHKCH